MDRHKGNILLQCDWQHMFRTCGDTNNGHIAVHREDGVPTWQKHHIQIAVPQAGTSRWSYRRPYETAKSSPTSATTLYRVSLSVSGVLRVDA
ncbi:unnamed protein product [Darwinula stevensoni]|uniref:Uncharacterized protein n=1 Tax=Darwinula stevensoni TaxID=69355 RepID=A0A7R9A3W0_9CRUS|nr:unnamed protein product [Darwinula stevensoni]CAG0882983.1 unnamed protein product [Darwinula stevensoni]